MQNEQNVDTGNENSVQIDNILDFLEKTEKDLGWKITEKKVEIEEYSRRTYSINEKIEILESKKKQLEQQITKLLADDKPFGKIAETMQSLILEKSMLENGLKSFDEPLNECKAECQKLLEEKKLIERALKEISRRILVVQANEIYKSLAPVQAGIQKLSHELRDLGSGERLLSHGFPPTLPVLHYNELMSSCANTYYNAGHWDHNIEAIEKYIAKYHVDTGKSVDITKYSKLIKGLSK